MPLQLLSGAEEAALGYADMRPSGLMHLTVFYLVVLMLTSSALALASASCASRLAMACRMSHVASIADSGLLSL